MTAPSHAWLEQLIRACDGAADRLEASADPVHEPLLHDIRALRARLEQQLEDLGR